MIILGAPADSCSEKENGPSRTDRFKIIMRRVIHGASSELCIGAKPLGRAVKSGSRH